MKVLKRLGKKVIIYIVVFMIVLSTIGSGCASAYTQQEIGRAVAGYALNLLKWGNEENLADGGPRLRYTQGDRNNHPTYNNENVALPWYYDCSSFTCAMYNIVCGMNITGGELDTSLLYNSNIFITVPASERQPGDILVRPKTVNKGRTCWDFY